MQIVPILIIVLFIFLFFKLKSKFKNVNTGCFTVIDGGLKCGKSTLNTYLSIRDYKRNLRQWKVKCFFCKLFKKNLPEKPVLISNIPLACDYVPLTLDLLLRKKRPPYKSILSINEGSLLADSKLIYDEEINKQILLFFKLFGHMTKGGKCYVDSQQISDLHFGMKRSTSNYIYIHSLTKWIPFILIANVRELLHNEDGDVINNFDGDIADSTKKIIFLKSVWKKFANMSWI